MNKEQLIEKLKEIAQYGDIEIAHSKADRALIEYINDPDITIEYENIEKWYA